MNQEDGLKTILIDFTPKISKSKSKSKNEKERTVSTKYDPKNRVVVDTKKWNNVVSQDTMTDQMTFLVDEHTLVKEHINAKIRGYRYQDLLKELYTPSEFVDYNYVIDLLRTCELKCTYCRLECMILYPHVREPRQWTLDRIQNHIGHNRENVQIACLNCNLRRKTILHERYLETKKIAKVRKITSEEDVTTDCNYEQG